jgi:hypothetical protein
VNENGYKKGVPQPMGILGEFGGDLMGIRSWWGFTSWWGFAPGGESVGTFVPAFFSPVDPIEPPCLSPPSGRFALPCRGERGGHPDLVGAGPGVWPGVSTKSCHVVNRRHGVVSVANMRESSVGAPVIFKGRGHENLMGVGGNI